MFFDILSRLRAGDETRGDLDILNSRVAQPSGTVSAEEFSDGVLIAGTNREVVAQSEMKLHVKNGQQNGTLMAQHLHGCKLAPLSVRQDSWVGRATLQRTKPRPFDPHVPPQPRASPPSRRQGDAGSPSGSASSRPASQLTTPSVQRFVDSVSAEQGDNIGDAILKVFVSGRVPFTLVESSSFTTMLKALRPAYVERKARSLPQAAGGPRCEQAPQRDEGSSAAGTGGMVQTSKSCTDS